MKLSKNKLKEEKYVLEQIGKEGKEGDKNAKEYLSKQEVEAKKAYEKTLEEAEIKRKHKFEYNQFIAELLIRELEMIDFPGGWKFKVAPTERGVVMELFPANGKILRGAFKTTGEGNLDLNAVHTFALRTEASIDRHTTIWTTQESHKSSPKNSPVKN